MSCPVMSEPLILAPGTLPKEWFVPSKDKKKKEEVPRQALEELIVPLTLALSTSRKDADAAENVVVAYRHLESSVRTAMKHSISTGNYEALCLLLSFYSNFYEFVADDDVQQWIEEACDASQWPMVKLLMKFGKKGRQAVPVLEEVATGEPERRSLGDAMSGWAMRQVQLFLLFVLFYGLILANARATLLSSSAMHFVRLEGTVPTDLLSLLATALFFSASIQSLAGASLLPFRLTGAIPLLFVASHLLLSVTLTARAVYLGLKDAVWSERSALKVVKVPKRIPLEFTPGDDGTAFTEQAKATKALDKKDEGAKMPPSGHPAMGEGGGKCPFAGMWTNE